MVGGLEEDGHAGRGRHVNTSGLEGTLTETSNEGPNAMEIETVERGMEHGDIPSHSDHCQDEAMRDVPPDREMAASADPEAIGDAECDNIDLIDDIDVLGDLDEPSAVGVDSENEKMTEDAADSSSEDCHADLHDDDGFTYVGLGDHIEAYGHEDLNSSISPSESDAALQISLMDLDIYQNHGADTQNTYDNDTGDDSNASVPRSGDGAYVGARQEEVGRYFLDLIGDDEIDFIDLTGVDEIDNGVDIRGSDGDNSNSDWGNPMLTRAGPGGDGPKGGASLEEIDLDHIPGSSELALAPGVRRNRQMANLNNDEEMSRATKRLRTADRNTTGGSISIEEDANFCPALDNVDVIPVTNAGAGNPSTIQWRHLTHGKEAGTGFNPQLLHQLAQIGSSDVRRWSTNIRFGGFCMFVLNVLPLHQNSSDADVNNLAVSISTWARNELNNSFTPVIENGITVGYTVNDAHTVEAATSATNDGDGGDHNRLEMALA